MLMNSFTLQPTKQPVGLFSSSDYRFTGNWGTGLSRIPQLASGQARTVAQVICLNPALNQGVSDQALPHAWLVSNNNNNIYGKRYKYSWKLALCLVLESSWSTDISHLAWRIPGMGEPGGLPSKGLHRVGHDWSDLAVAAAVAHELDHGRLEQE